MNSAGQNIPMPDSAIFSSCKALPLVAPVQYRGNNPVFRDILNKLTDGSVGTCQSIFNLAGTVEKQAVTIDDFRSFLQAVHDVLIHVDSPRRSSLFRVIRYCLTTMAHVQVVVDEQIHYIVIMSLEKESDYSMERIQALKIVDRSRRVCGHTDLYPTAFARSLVAIANSKEDNFRKIAIESLRELALANPTLIASVQGFPSLVDAIIDPVSQDIADSIMHTILFLMNDPSTRKIVSPCVDLKSILVSFTDVDSDAAELAPKLHAAKCAFNIMMRSWIGIYALSSDDSALPMLMKMLKDTKVPIHTLEVILDSVIDVLNPLFSKVKYSTRGKRHPYSSTTSRDMQHGGPMQTTSSSSKLYSETMNKSRHARSNSDSDMINNGPPVHSAAFDSANPPNLSNSSSSSSLQQLNRESFSRPSFSFLPHHSNDSSTVRSSMSGTSNAASAAAPAAPSKHFSISSLFTSRGSRNTPKSNQTPAAAVTGTSTSNKDFTTLSTEQRDVLRRASINNNSNANGNSAGGNSSSGTRSPLSPNLHVEEEDFADPIFNLMDNYTALICCSFLHVDLLSSLVVLGIESKPALAHKSRVLLVKFVQILANVLPESSCAELLTNPSLIEVAASLEMHANQAYNASQLLFDIAHAFSLLPSPQEALGTHVVSSLGAGGQSGTTTTTTTTPNVSNRARNTSITSSGKDGTLTSTMTRANFLPLNVETVYEFAQEIRISSSHSSAAWKSSQSLDALQNLRMALTPVSDKNDFNKLMEVSRVIGKEGKEPFKWDWQTISDMLEYSFDSSDRLSEALKTKWVRRVSGFFRCSIDDKAYFANLDWEPTNLQYFECACSLYSLLMRDEQGLSFILGDRRGMLFSEIARELEQLLMQSSSMVYMSSSATGAVASGPKNVFRLSSMTNQMSREFFALLGRVVRSPSSRKILDQTNIFKSLSQLGQYPSLAYLCRTVLTSLTFTDSGMMSKHLLQMWTTQSTCSTDCRQYYHSLLRVMLLSFAGNREDADGDFTLTWLSPQRAAGHNSLATAFSHTLSAFSHSHANTQTSVVSLRHNANFQWCIEALVSQLAVDDDSPSPMILKAMNEAIQHRLALRLVISKRPKIIDEPLAQELLVRFAAVPEGLDYLIDKHWLDRAFSEWLSARSAAYVLDIEERLSVALMATIPPNSKSDVAHGPGALSTSWAGMSRRVLFTPPSRTHAGQSVANPMESDANSVANGYGDPNILSKIIRIIQPIPIKTPEPTRELSASVSTSSSSLNIPQTTTSRPSNSSLTGDMGHQANSSSTSVSRGNANASLAVDMQGLLRMPWNVDVKLISQSTTTSTAETMSGEYLKMDTFLDMSDMASALCFELCADSNRIFKVRSLVLDSKGLPNGRVISPTATIAATLMTGVCAVLRTGRVQPTALQRSQVNRRRASNAMPPNQNMRGSVSATSNAAANNANNAAAGDAGDDPSDDLPVSLGQELMFDWFICRPTQRQGQLVSGDQGKLYLAVPGEPAVFVFERRNVATTSAQRSDRTETPSSSTRGDLALDNGRHNMYNYSGNSRASALYLVEIQYFFRIETGASIFVPMPRHLYGELSRTLEGCAQLARRNLVMDLVNGVRSAHVTLCATASATAFSSPSTSTAASPVKSGDSTLFSVAAGAGRFIGHNTIDLRANLWSVGHIAATEFGFNAVMNADPFFVEWCIEAACTSPFFTLRATFFYVLGLISRTVAGSRKLNRLRWDCAIHGSNSAVALPRSPAVLFRKLVTAVPPPVAKREHSATRQPTSTLTLNTLQSNSTANTSVYSKSPALLTPLSAAVGGELLIKEQEVIYIISKMPGVIIYRECKSRLESIKKEFPELFSRRTLFLEVMRTLESYTFKLTARREIINLFSDSAKQKQSLSQAASPQQ